MRPKRSTVAVLLSVGGALWAGLALELTLLWAWDAKVGAAALGGLTAEIFTGREGGIPVAISGGVPPILVFQISATQDIAAFCITFPGFLWLLHHYHDRDNFLMRRVRRLEAAAARHQELVRKWGPVGIFLFMMTPFIVNGPVVGGIVGKLAGMRTRYLLAPVVLATAAASAAWALFFEQTVGRLRDIDARLGYLVAALILGGLTAATAVGVWLDNRRPGATDSSEE